MLPSWGAVRAARRTRVARTGFCLCGMVDEPPRRCLGDLRDLAAGQGEHVVRDATPRICRPHRGVADAGERSPRGVPGPGGRQPERSGQSLTGVIHVQTELHRRSHGAGGSAQLEREVQGGQLVVDVEDAVEPGRSLEPEGGRDRVLGRGCGRPAGCPGASRSRTTSASTCVVSARANGGDRVAQGHHQRAVQDVLARETTVQPASSVPVPGSFEPPAQEVDQGDHRGAVALRRSGHVVEVVGGELRQVRQRRRAGRGRRASRARPRAWRGGTLHS